ncbi:hypothetical protein EFL26_22280 [Nocardioides pocheonensis]|uniref:Uncharacterized protein n=2 Tax=Nocardioides pocheonensis TaxID=661485 RepID=A0A3N0GHE3_9ACTN|nr:hypothetical protein EFL26_22280 [Nocardioides pocheonensis]
MWGMDDEQPDDGELVPVEGGEHVVISDGDGLAVIGNPQAVEQYLRRKGLWEASTGLDLSWLRPVLTFGAEAVHSAAEAVASSGRWVKLTVESAEDAKQHGLMDTKTPGVRWLMAGKPGDISKWLATETGPMASAATNPEALSGLASLLSNAAGAMAQLERRHEVREITELLTAIDGKLDDVRRTQRDGVLAKLDGVSFAISEAMSIREKTGHVSAPSWSKVQHLTADIAEIASNALRALDALASKAGSAAKVRELAKHAPEIAGEVDVWLSVLARCFQLHEEAAVLELDHVREVAPLDLDGHRLALNESRDGLRGRITQTTVGLVRRLDQAASDADLEILLHSRSVRAIVQSSNAVGDSVMAFQAPLGIEIEREAVSSAGWRAALGKPDQLRVAAKEAGTKALYGVGAVAVSVASVVVARSANDKDLNA